MEIILGRPLGRVFNRFYLLVTGVLLVAIGLMVLFRPFQFYWFISLFFPVLIILSGGCELFFAWHNRTKLTERAYVLLGGGIDLALGIYFLAASFLALTVVTPLICSWLFYKGFISMRLALFLRNECYAPWWKLLVNGFVISLIALVVMANATAGVMSMLVWTGLGIVLTGISYVKVWIYQRAGGTF